eukprot:scaffold1282_cov251-Pinguiococcus_pyrenoidosus.AAC.55
MTRDSQAKGALRELAGSPQAYGAAECSACANRTQPIFCCAPLLYLSLRRKHISRIASATAIGSCAALPA